MSMQQFFFLRTSIPTATQAITVHNARFTASLHFDDKAEPLLLLTDLLSHLLFVPSAAVASHTVCLGQLHSLRISAHKH